MVLYMEIFNIDIRGDPFKIFFNCGCTKSVTVSKDCFKAVWTRDCAIPRKIICLQDYRPELRISVYSFQFLSKN